MRNPSIDEIKDVFEYSPETGILRWKNATGRRRKTGEIAGCKSTDGRILIGFKGKLFKAHRIAWAIMTGEWPKLQIDHINEDPSDNRWKNLRLANKSQNMRNITRIKSNTSGYKGVSFFKRTEKWRATIAINKKQIHLGYFKTAEEARDAYREASIKFHEEFAKHD